MRVRSWRTWTLALAIMLGVGGAVVGSAQDEDGPADQEPPIWQQSQVAVVQLGIRDKLGTLGRYTVCFVVWTPDERMVTVTRTVENDDSCDVYFPDDFDTYDVPGNYTWEGRVYGKKVIGGAFEFKRSASYCGSVHMLER